MAYPLANQALTPTGSPAAGWTVTYKLAVTGEPNGNPVLGTTTSGGNGWWAFADVGTSPVDVYVDNGTQMLVYKGLASIPHSFGDPQVSATAGIQTTKIDDGDPLNEGVNPASYTPTTLGMQLNKIVSQLKLLGGGTNWYSTPATNVAALNSAVASVGYNLLDNPGFEVWQRGAGPYTGNGNYTADRWYISIGGSSTVSVQRELATVDSYSLAALRMAYSHAGGGSASIGQRVENGSALRGQTLTLSVRVKADVANRVYVRLADGVGLTDSARNTGTGWETLSVTRTLDAAATYVQLEALWDVATGTTYVDNATLAMTSVALPYRPLTAADELARCYRYAQLYGGTPTAPLAIGSVQTVNSSGVNLLWRAPFGGTPTVTVGNPTTGFQIYTVGIIPVSNVVATNISYQGCQLDVTHNNASGGGARLVAHATNTPSGYVLAEWNPT